MKGLMLLERVVLESISRKNSRLLEISKDIEISQEIVITILARLSSKGLVFYRDNGYELSQNQIAWHTVNREEAVKDELKELSENIVDTCMSNKEKTLYKLQKISLNDKEERILNSLLNSVEVYINNLRDDRKKQIGYKEVTAKQKVVFWGHSSYSQVVLSSIDSAS